MELLGYCCLFKMLIKLVHQSPPVN